MSLYRKRPIEVEAVRYAGGNDREGYFFDEMQPPWLAEAFRVQPGHAGSVWRRLDGKLRIATLEGEMVADQGDWIIRGVAGEIYPCKPTVFDATYEPA